MKKLFLITFLLLITACGKVKHNVSIPNTTQTIEIDLGFEKAAQFCDSRYGDEVNQATGELKAEECFMDYRNFVDLGLEVGNFCELQYDTKEEVDACKKELRELVVTDSISETI